MSAFAIRGVVEGFYGAPYTRDERASLIRFLGRHGYTHYVYGPKNDRAHRARWRTPYEPEALDDLAHAIGVARASGVAFCFALSPGLDVRYGSRDDEDAVLEKLSAVAALGVHDFALFLDDIAPEVRHREDGERFGTLAAAQASLCNRVLHRLRAIDPGVALATCPTHYHGRPPFDRQLVELGARLDPAIDVLYTGPEVCSARIERADVEAFAQAVGRPPIVWDNYPVNDGEMRSELHVGPIRGRDPDLAGAVRGFVVNPMNQVEASKIALHTFAAYFADPAGYDPDRAWAAAVDEVVGAAHAPAFRIFAATAMHGPLGTPVAPELEAAADAALTEVREGEDRGRLAALRALLDELDEACATLVSRLRDDALRAELLPWVEALDAWVWAGIRASEAAAAMRGGEDPSPSLRRLREPLARATGHHKRSGGSTLLPFVEHVAAAAGRHAAGGSVRAVRSSGDLVLLLDYGGTKLAAAVAPLGARPAPAGAGDERPAAADGWVRGRVERPPGADGAYDRAAMTDLARRLLDGREAAVVGVSFGGPVRPEGGVVRRSHHVDGWDEVPLAALLHEAFGVPCTVDNDANAGALGESRFGAGRGAHSLLYVTVSTGIGGGWILDGRVWRGAEGMAGEFGHITHDPEGPDCVCGRSGCVERLAAGPAIAEAARRALRERPEDGAVLRRSVGGDLDALTTRDVAAAAGAGDALSAEVLASAATVIGTAIGGTANLMNPGRVVLGGGVTHAGEAFWRPLRCAAAAHTMPEVTLDLVAAALGDDAPLWGALAAAEDLLAGRAAA